ncbi:MAG: hypothetical protein SOX32_04940 [Candidatus Choladocola sp.]|nr:hypothetical protein [Candidatus Choladocola sp.]
MLKLMKYEFRKTMFSKMILLIITAVVEVAYLAGVFLKWEKGLAIGMVGLVFCAVIGIFYIGIESLIVFQKDLNTKRSYMLFMTPRNSYEILGAKVLENGISIFLTGACFGLLAAVDMSIAVLYIGGLQEFLDMLRQLAITINVEIDVPAVTMVLTVISGLASWLMMVVTGYFAIILCATVLAGKRFSGLVSFLLYLLIGWGTGTLLDLIPEMANRDLRLGIVLLASFGIVAAMYVVSGWIMERKLSV